jgi:arylsulfatase A-like enzyme
MGRLGARVFTLAWALYALAEFAFGILGPGIQDLIESGRNGLNPWVGVAVMVAWPLLGAVLGGLLGIALRGPLERCEQRGFQPSLLLASLASASVVVAISLNLLYGDSFGRSGFVVVSALFGTIVVSFVRRDGFLAAAGHPWIIVPTLVAWLCAIRVVWIEAPLGLRVGVTLCLLGAGAAAVRLIGPRIAQTPMAGTRLIAGSFAAALIGLFLTHHVPAPALPAPTAAQPEAPPVILIVLDTVRADHLSTYGYERATDPNLARFAETATVYERGIASGDMTLTSHASLFTGRWVAHHGAVPGAPQLPATEKTLAESLKQAGYATAGVAANCGWIASGRGMDQGFDYWDTRCEVSPFNGIGSPYLRSRLVGKIRHYFFPAYAMWEWRSAETITNEGLRVLDRLATDDAPFFLFLNYMDVHRPIHPPEQYRTRFPGHLSGFDMMADWSAMNKGAASGKREPNPAERAHLISQYDGALAYIDDQLARVFAELQQRELLDRSLIFIVSDHGESFGAHSSFGHGKSVYQDVVGIPFIVKQPGQRKGQRVQDPVGLADVLPSIAASLGLEVADDLDGRSLFSPDLDPARPIISESYSIKGRQMHAIVQGQTKWIGRPEGAGELYSLDVDPDELDDLATQQTVLAKELASAFDSVLSGGAAGQEHSLEEEDIRRLQALGYLELE